MVSPIDEIDPHRRSICDEKLSTVVPASITGEDVTYHFTNVDLAMKLHYVTTVHFYDADAVEGLGIQDFKRPMFHWLQPYYPICGRIRRLDGGRPFIKCNDSGVRIVEAMCSKTMAEWLESVGGGDHHRLLVYRQPILAHDFGFTPLVFLQLTKFKCGGLSVGMKWTHVVGDAFSASECINLLGKIMANQTFPSQPLITPSPSPHSETPLLSSCRCLKPLQSVGDNWLTPNSSKLQMHTFHLTEQQLRDLLSGENKTRYDQVRPFELISAILWKSLAKVRGNNAKVVTVCKRRGSSDHTNVENALLGNVHQVIGVVEAETMSAVTDGNPIELAKMIGEKFVDEMNMIENWMGQGKGDLDCVVYGSNLTFVNLEEADIHGLQIRGRGPVYAGLSIGGVGGGGAVVVGPHAWEAGGGRTVNVILSEGELLHLKNELRTVCGIS